MNILLELPYINESKLSRITKFIQAQIDTKDSSLIKELGVLVIKALDYHPIEIHLSDLDFFRANYSRALQDVLDKLEKEESVDFDDTLFWLAFYLHVLQFEAVTLKNNFGPNDIELGAFLEQNFPQFPTNIQQSIRYISYKLGADIANFRLGNHVQKELSEINSKLNEMKQTAEKIETWNKNLEIWELKVKSQEDRLKEQLVKLNFVGLSKAFQNLSDSKNTERVIHAAISLFIAIVFIFTPLAILIASTKYPSLTLNDLSVIDPLAAFEFSLLYFFRVALQNYSSAKAQLLQIKLRLELCAFVEGYAEFIEPIRTKGGVETLSKFESIVFSGISPDPQNVPSQFDGLENILQLLKTLRNDK